MLKNANFTAPEMSMPIMIRQLHNSTAGAQIMENIISTIIQVDAAIIQTFTPSVISSVADVVTIGTAVLLLARWAILKFNRKS